MLENLHISNYALIDKVDIRFYPGFNIITGETGAGKSIMLGALSLLLGGRADSRVVRQADKKSVIEAVFAVKGYATLKTYCLTNDIEWDDERCILRREISPNGRSRAFVNDSPVPLAKLEEVGMFLVDLHSQHQNQLLARSDFQLSVIDTLASNQQRLGEYASRYNAMREALLLLKRAKAEQQRGREDEDFLRYQLEQLDEMNLQPGEQAQLEQDREVLANISQIKSSLNDALQALSDAPSNVLSLLDEAQEAVSQLDNVIDEEDKIGERLESSTIEIRDIAETLTEIDRRLMADPRELDIIEDRLNAIYTLENKHKVETYEELLNVREQLRNRLERLDNSDDHIAELERDFRRKRALARETSASLTQERKKAAQEFANELKNRAMPLGMTNLQCEVKIEPIDMSPTGADRVEWTFAFNKNQPLMPVGGAASGGEISRLMLTIKAIIADKMNLPSIIFDEVDTGVSGDVANRIGKMMQSIAENLQVIAITHLPQVAARGSHHFKVFKYDDENSTHTSINELTYEQRVDELALMLSGNSANDAARANATTMLSQNKSIE